MTQPAYGTPPGQRPQGNGLAIAGMVCGIVGLVLFFLSIIGMLVALLGVIFGAIGLAKSKRVGRGKGAALTGVICGGLGLVVSVFFYVVAIRAFTEYVKKSKTSEAELQLRQIEKKVKTFHNVKQRLPATAQLMPKDDACGGPNFKHQAEPETAWRAAGWDEMGFHVDEDSHYTYSWTVDEPTGPNARGHALAIGDLDCDGTAQTYRLDIENSEGNLRATYSQSGDD